MNTLHERHQTELGIINDLHFVTIKDLAARLSVSEMTVRRDCALLANQGLIKQVYGGVTSRASSELSSYSVNHELDKNTITKEKIARKALSLLRANEVFFMDSGTTVATMARLLPSQSSYTIITPSFLALQSLVKLDDCSIISPGGVYQNKPQVLYNQETATVLRRYRAGKCFIGATGFDIHHGITCGYLEDVPLKQAMLDCSKERILITDSSKFNTVSTCMFAEISTFTAVITDEGIPQVYKDFIQSFDIELHLV